MQLHVKIPSMEAYRKKLPVRTWLFSLFRVTLALILDGEGAELVRLARRAVETYLRDSRLVSPEKDDPLRAGVFVTLNYLTRNKEEHLRGCIGFPLPEKRL